jgi:UDP-N-acetylmuramoylalanine--D-glutamate ligase
MTINVVGLGATGLSLVRHLHSRGARITVLDGNEEPAAAEQLRRDYSDVTLRRCDVAHDVLPPSDLIALSPGVPRASFAIQRALDNGTPVVGDVELFARAVAANAKTFAITGSNGKTTTTALAGALAKTIDPGSIVAGNIGLPILDALAANPAAKTWVLELSSFQLESTSSLALENAAVLNVSANHLDRYHSFFHYAAVKESIFAHSRRQVVNRDDLWSMSMRRDDLTTTTFGMGAPAADDIGMRQSASLAEVVRNGDIIVDVSKMRLRGNHNVMNAMAAYALIRSMGLDHDNSRQVLEDFSGVAHRYQWMGSVAGVDIINDSKATTVVATVSALSGNQSPTWLIAGGDGKGQSFDDLATAASTCRAVHLIGRDADSIAAALGKRGVPYRKFSALDDAVSEALDQARAGDVVLLSPACASWDMFRNFEHRAEVFNSAVNAWAHAHGRTLDREVNRV